jgi:hypothetical protein
VRLESPGADLTSWRAARRGRPRPAARAAPTRPRHRAAAQRPSRQRLTIEDPPIEDVIEQVFADQLPAEGTAPAEPAAAGGDQEARSRPRDPPAGRLPRARTHHAILEQFQYRVANYFYDRHDRQAGHLPGRLDDDRERARRLGRRLYGRPVRCLLHRLALVRNV